MARVVFTFKPYSTVFEILEREGVDYVYFEGRMPPKEWFEENLKDAEVIIAPAWQPLNAELMNLAPNLRLILIHGSGVDKVDVHEASRRGVCVANAPDMIAQAVAEHALALTLAVMKNVVRGDACIRSSCWDPETQRYLTTRLLRGKRVGVIGLGRVGSEVAKLFNALGAEVIYWSRSRKIEVEHALDLKYIEFEELLKTSDVVVIAIALTPETKGLLSHRELSMLKPGAVLINVSRGPIVDEEALVKALSEGRIYAGLDVYAVEPLPKDSELVKLENTVLTPHIAGFAHEALRGTSEFVTREAVRFIKEGGLPYTTLNREGCIK
ncbi:MAG: NAD(P)-dependent oxidoreductase [Zestosphaera sp.]